VKVKKVEKSLFHFSGKSLKVKKVKKSLFHSSRKGLKVKKVKSESDSFSLSNICVYLNAYKKYLQFISYEITEFP